MKADSFKKEKFSNQIMDRCNQILRSEIHDERLTFVSITRVELSDDYAYAKLYWDTFDSAQKNIVGQALDQNLHKLRKYLSSSLKVRQVPHLSLVYDSQYDDELRITQLLNSEKENQDNEE